MFPVKQELLGSSRETPPTTGRVGHTKPKTLRSQGHLGQVGLALNVNVPYRKQLGPKRNRRP